MISNRVNTQFTYIRIRIPLNHKSKYLGGSKSNYKPENRLNKLLHMQHTWSSPHTRTHTYRHLINVW